MYGWLYLESVVAVVAASVGRFLKENLQRLLVLGQCLLVLWVWAGPCLDLLEEGLDESHLVLDASRLWQVAMMGQCLLRLLDQTLRLLHQLALVVALMLVLANVFNHSKFIGYLVFQMKQILKIYKKRV